MAKSSHRIVIFLLNAAVGQKSEKKREYKSLETIFLLLCMVLGDFCNSQPLSNQHKILITRYLALKTTSTHSRETPLNSKSHNIYFIIAVLSLIFRYLALF